MSPLGARSETLALHGGRPVRDTWLPYGRQQLDDSDVAAVTRVLRSDRLTTGPSVAQFEDQLASVVGATHAVAFSSGTAALHAAAAAAGLSRGDEAITTPFTFCATANCLLYCDATPVFADIEADTLTIDVARIEAHLSEKTRAVLPVDFAGHPARLDLIRAIADRNRLIVIEDACHALGATLGGARVGSLSDMTVFSFHPVKHITTGEGGAVTTDDATLARRMRRFRTHGIESVPDRGEPWYYEMVDLGYNYRLTDISCALGSSQLNRLGDFLARRRAIAAQYLERLGDLAYIVLPRVMPGATSAWHLFPIRFRLEMLTGTRGDIVNALHAENIGVQVHYIPVHLHPYYRARFGFTEGQFPVAEDAYRRIVSLPLFPAMSDGDVDDVVAAVRKVTEQLAR